MRPTFPTLSALAALALLAVPAVAQRLVAYDAGAPAMFETQPTSTFHPVPTPSMPAYPMAPPLPAPPAFAVPVGDLTVDGVTGLVWYSNGQMLAAMRSPTLPANAQPVPPFAIAAGVLNVIGGPATGIAMDPRGGILWLTSSPGVVVGVLPIPGTPVVSPAFIPAFAMNPITGLDWDGITGTLLSVDTIGNVYRYFPGGPAFAPVIPRPFPLPGIATGVAIDKSGVRNGAGVRPIFVGAGGTATDVLLPGAVPFPVSGNGPDGLAFLPVPASTPFFGGCACGTMMPTLSVTAPMTAGNAAFGLQVNSLMPGQLVLYAFDFVFNPAFPLWNTTGCGSGLVLGSPTLITALAFANGSGTATFGMPLFAPPGFGPLYNQNLTPCPFDPAGFSLTPMQQLAACGL